MWQFIEGVLGVLMALGFRLAVISPLIALVFAIIFYVHHRNRVEPKRRISIVVYILAVIACGVVGGLFGLYVGVKLTCSSPKAGNLCGIWGFLIVGPLSCALAIFLLTFYLVRPRNSSPQSK